MMKNLLAMLMLLSSHISYAQLDTALYKKEVFLFMDQFWSEYKAESDSLSRIYGGESLDSFLLSANGALASPPDTVEDIGERDEQGHRRSHKIKLHSIGPEVYECDPLFFQSFKWPDNFLGSRIIQKAELDTIFVSEIGDAEEWKKFRNKYGNHELHYFTIPYFNAAMTEAVFDLGGSWGYSSSWSESRLYKKISGKWTFVKWLTRSIT